MAGNFGDLDNDGYLDFYLGTGYPDYEALMPNVMYRNRRGTGFADVTSAGGFGHLQKGHGIAFADLDNDGDQDVFEQMGGFLPGDKYFNVAFENPGFGNHWIGVELVGVRSNRSAIGARIRAEVVENGRRRSIYKHVNSGGSFGANPLRQTIGLGEASTHRSPRGILARGRPAPDISPYRRRPLHQDNGGGGALHHSVPREIGYGRSIPRWMSKGCD